MLPMTLPRAEAILDFWFGRPNDPDYGQPKKYWFIKDPAFDEAIREQFLAASTTGRRSPRPVWRC